MMWIRLGKLARLMRRRLYNRKGERVPLIRNYPLQYVWVGSLFLVAGMVTVALNNPAGWAAIAFGLAGYAFAILYYIVG